MQIILRANPVPSTSPRCEAARQTLPALRGPSGQPQRINIPSMTTRLPTRRCNALASSSAPQSSFATAGSSDEEPQALKWFEKPSNWASVDTVEGLEAALKASGGKLIAVEFYAG